MTTITCTAAVAFGPNTELKFCQIQVAPPRNNEVRIKLVSTSVCHTDIYTWSGRDPEGIFPCILGHEGAGIVESVGPDVQDVKVGDHVVPLYTPECRKCKFCTSGKTNLCQAIRAQQGKGLMPDGTTRFSYEGQPIYHYMGCSTFSEYTVVPEIAVAVVDKNVPLQQLCLLGCGVPTGFGAPCNTAKVEKGSTCAIIGLGCIGLACILGCRHQQAGRIIGIDKDENKFELARKFGATECINPTKIPEGKDMKDYLIEITDGGVDYSFECVGNPKLMRQALEATHKGWGQSIIIGVAAAGEEISTRPFQLVTGRVWKGTAYGGVRGRTDLPKFVNMVVNNELPLADFITDKMPFKNLNACFAAPHGEKLQIRVLLTFD